MRGRLDTSKTTDLKEALPYMGLLILGGVSLLIPDHNHDIGYLSMAASLSSVLVFIGWFLLPLFGAGRFIRETTTFAYLSAVAFLRFSDGGSTSGFSPLAALPVVWMALHGTRRQLWYSIGGVAIIFATPVVIEPTSPALVSDWRRAVLWVLSSAITGLTIFGLRTKLETSSRQRHELIESLEEGIIHYDLVGNVVEANSSALRLLEVQAVSELSISALGHRVVDYDANNATTDLPMAVTLSQNISVLRQAIELRLDSGVSRWFSISAIPIIQQSGRTRGVAASFTDITAAREASAILAHQASHDPLTGLGNRRSLMSVLIELERHERASTTAVLYLDLDGFKAINDSLGHDIGDIVLREVGAQLRNALSSSQQAFRLGGDEFVVLAQDTPNVREAELLANILITRIGNIDVMNQSDIRVTTSIGIALSSSRTRGTELLSLADDALYVAKRQGKNRFHYLEHR